MLISTKDLENSAKKVSQEEINKREYSKYGNRDKKRKENKNKRIKYIKISQLNKGSSHLKKHLDLLKMTIEKIILES